MTQLRVGVVGLGVGHAHVRAYQSLPDQFRVMAVCDLDAARAERVAQQGGIPHVAGSLEELLGIDALDVVDVCTPPYLHFEHCQAALEAGRNVVCEKPLVGSLAEVDALARRVAAAGRTLMPIFQYRFGAGFQKLLRLIERGVAGRAYLATVETSWLRGAAYYAVPWRGRWATERGGVLLTHAIHAHDLLTCALGPVRSVFARAATRVNPIETEDCATASLEMADGSLATLAATLGSQVEISRLRFCFENLTAESSLAPYTPAAEPWTFTLRDDGVHERAGRALADFVPGPAGYAGQLLGFHRALESGGPPPVTIEDARASLELATALYHSAETGAPVELPLGPDHPRWTSWLPARAATR